MRTSHIMIFILSALLTLSSCAGDKGKTVTPPETNSFVEGCSFGKISRYGEIGIRFNESIPEEKRTEEYLQKVFSISPSVEGKFISPTPDMVVFRHNEPFEADSRYDIDADIDKLFEADTQDKSFTFAVLTNPLTIDSDIISVVAEEASKGETFAVRGYIRTSDKEKAEVIKNIIDFEGVTDFQWVGTESVSNKFEFCLQHIPAKKTKQYFDIKVKRNRFGYDKTTLYNSYKIPSSEGFEITSIRLSEEDDNAIIVSFNKPLDCQSRPIGIVTIKDEPEPRVEKNSSQLKIWPASKNETVSLRIFGGLKSIDNLRLGASDMRYNIDMNSNAPSLSFIDNGVIMPRDGGNIILFKAQSLKGVIVRVIKIHTNNMNQFLQSNDISEAYGLSSVGSLLCTRLIFLDEMTQYDIRKKNVFALDLKDLIKVEPGALYNVALSYNYDLSAYPVEGPQKSKDELREEYRLREIREKESLAKGKHYMNFEDQSYDDYSWNESKNPARTSFYYDKETKRNFQSSDLGLIAKMGSDDFLFVSVNNLSDAKPMGDVSVSAYSYNNQLIAEQTTWDDGSTKIRLDGKRPHYIIAQKDEQYGFLRLTNSESLSSSSFDVEGEQSQNGLRGFIYAERGVWRPGDTLNIGFILNDPEAKLPTNHPVTLEFYNPQSQMFFKKTKNKSSDGIYCFQVLTNEKSPTGLWNCQVKVGSSTFSRNFRIETIKPNRLSIDIKAEDDVITGENIDLKLKSSWLTGAKASNLKYDITTTVTPCTTEFSNFKNYVFDNPAKSYTVYKTPAAQGYLNNEGDAGVRINFSAGKNAPGMLNMQLLTKVFEPGGDFSMTSDNLKISPFPVYVGIRSPQKDEQPLLTGKNHSFEVACVDSHGKGVAGRRLACSIYKVEWYWWWNVNNYYLADYISSEYNDAVSEWTTTTDAEGKSSFSLNFEDDQWGTYFIRLTDKEGHETGTLAYFDLSYDMGRNADGSDQASRLAISTDKEKYAPDDDITLRFPSAADSHALITVENNNGVSRHFVTECKKGETIYKITATEDMMPNAYISVTLLNPFKDTGNSLPIRLYGTIPVYVNSEESQLSPVIKCPETIYPGSKFNISVSEKDGRRMSFTLAVVDEGLLNLTRYKTPSPWDAFNAKQALGVRSWDLYDYVCGSYTGKIQQMFSIGGDNQLYDTPNASANRFEPVAIFKGPYTLKKGETRQITLDMPNYAGKVRCMVIASDGKNAYGNAEKNITVKQSVMVLGTLPRLLNPGDEIELPATVFAMEPKIGKVNVSIQTNDCFEVIGNNSQNLNFTEKGSQLAWFRLKVKDQTGVGNVSIKADMGKEKSLWNTEILISSALSPVSQVKSYTLEKGKSLDITLQGIGISGTNSGNVQISAMRNLNLRRQFNYLENYPYSCIEQISSQGIANLMLPNLLNLQESEKLMMDNKVKSTISKMRNYMVPGGLFSYWPGRTSAEGWGSIYATNFLIYALVSGYEVPMNLATNAIEAQSRIAQEWSPVNTPYLASEQLIQAYRLYVLALSGQPQIGAMNRLSESEIPATARYLLASAYAMAGQELMGREQYEKIGDTAFNEQASVYTYGSPLRDKAIQLLSAIHLGRGTNAKALADELTAELEQEEYMNTQSSSFAIMALTIYFQVYPVAGSLDFTATIDGNNYSQDSGMLSCSYPVYFDKKTCPVKISNKSDGTIYVTTLLNGIPGRNKQISTANGIAISTTYTDRNGKSVNPASLPQGSDFKMTVTVTNKSGVVQRNLMMRQNIAPGWEIISVRHLDGESNADNCPQGISYQDIRDTRVDSYIPLLPADAQVSSTISVTAAYAGKYYLPGSSCEAMYNPQISASGAGREVTIIK